MHAGRFGGTCGRSRRRGPGALVVVTLAALVLTAAPAARSQEGDPWSNAFGATAFVFTQGIGAPPEPAVRCPEGDDREANLVRFTVEDVVTIGSLEVRCGVDELGVSAAASASAVDIALPGVENVSVALAEAECLVEGESASGRSNVAGLTIDGEEVEVTGEPNQTILLPGPQGAPVRLVLNAHSGSPDEQSLVQAVQLDGVDYAYVSVAVVVCGTNRDVPEAGDPLAPTDPPASSDPLDPTDRRGPESAPLPPEVPVAVIAPPTFTG